MDWNAFWSGLLGTTVPALVVSVLLLVLNHRTNRALEKYRAEMAEELSRTQSFLAQRSKMLTFWHEKRVASLLEIYEAFRQYLDFLRRALFIKPHKGVDVSPQHDFCNSIQKHLVFFDDALRQKVLSYQNELLEFWNWSVCRLGEENDQSWDEVQRRLDYEVPLYLEKLRRDINEYADPAYTGSPDFQRIAKLVPADPIPR